MRPRSAPSPRDSGSRKATGYNSSVATASGRTQSRARQKPKSPTWWRVTKITFCVVATVGFIGGCFGLFTFMNELQDAQQEVRKFQQMHESFQAKPSEIYSSDGQLLYSRQTERREYVSIDGIPQFVQNAMIAAEDKRFREHAGVDPWALGRIILVNGREGRMAQGGSTITMQLAKLVSENSEKTFSRKFHDIALAVATERQLQKDQILELYLNKVYFGNQAYGIQAAAENYFGKPVTKLSLGEAALLVRLVRKPSSWAHLNEGVNLDAAIKNRNIVLGIMLEEKMIQQDAYEKALQEVPKFNKNPLRTTAHIFAAPYFVSHVLRVLEKDYPDVDLKLGGYRIETTIDLGMQAIADQAVRETVRDHRDDGVNTGAFVLMNGEGQILAEVGGLNYKKNQYNYVYRGSRQPGSSFKPFVYATAFLDGKLNSVDDEISNERFTLPPGKGRREEWSPRNDDGRYGGSVTARTALALSMNVPAVRVMDMVGVSEVVRTASEVFGFQSKIHPYLTSALGASEVNMLEMAQAYSVFMLRGDRATPFTIRRIIGPSGEILHDPAPRIERNRLDPDVCQKVDELLKGVIDFGTGTAAQIVPNARGKTGTTSDNKDAWFCGYTDGLVGIGWVAHERRNKDGSISMLQMGRHVFGGTVTVDFWSAVMKAAHEKYGNKFAVRTDAGVARSDEQAEEKRQKADQKAREKTEEKPPAAGTTDELPKMGSTDDTTTTEEDAPADPSKADTRFTPVGGKPKPDPDSGDKPKKPVKKDPDLPAETPSSQTEERQAEPIETVSYVTVQVCAESGKRATNYCNETVSRRFKKGTEPKSSCPLHRG